MKKDITHVMIRGEKDTFVETYIVLEKMLICWTTYELCSLTAERHQTWINMGIFMMIQQNGIKQLRLHIMQCVLSQLLMVQFLVLVVLGRIIANGDEALT